MDSYNQTLDYLYALQRHGIKLSLDNIKALLTSLNNPQNDWRSIHIAGTNGKGSTAAMMESVLMQAGYKVGLYTSPHLVDFRERIRINRLLIPQQDVMNFTKRMLPLIEEINPSFFEVATAMAFWYFAKEKVDIALIEVGLGGRLDSTNVIAPLISVVSSIDMDHQKYLGNTIQGIAAEKAGIIKPGIPCITNNQNRVVLEVLCQKCLLRNSELIKIHERASYRIHEMNLDGTSLDLQIADNSFRKLYVNLPGEHQIENTILALGTLLFLKNKLKVSIKDIFAGLADVSWKGRIDLLKKEPFIIVDVSHNASGFKKTLSFVGRFISKEKINVITSLQEDKDYQKIGKLLSHYVSNVYVVNLKLGKPLESARLLNTLLKNGVKSSLVNSFTEIIQKFYDLDLKDKVWLIIGSHYLAGEAYQKIQTS